MLNAISAIANVFPLVSNSVDLCKNESNYKATHALSLADALLAVAGVYSNVRRARHAHLLAQYYKHASQSSRRKMQKQRNMMLALLLALQYANEYKHKLPNSITEKNTNDASPTITDNLYVSTSSIGVHLLKLIWMEQQLKRAKKWKAAQEQTAATNRLAAEVNEVSSSKA